MGKIKKGEYFRKYGVIDQVTDIVRRGDLYEDSGVYCRKYGKFCMGSCVMDEMPHSFDIMDLIEPGDYVNGFYVLGVHQEPKYLITDIGKIEKEEIKTVMTKEEFEKRSFVVD